MAETSRQPRMSENGVDGRSLRWLLLENPPDEVLTDAGQCVGVLDRGCGDSALHLHHRFTRIGWLSRAQLVGQNSKRPDVSLCVMAANSIHISGVLQSLRNLGRNVCRSAAHCGSGALRVDGPAKIRQRRLLLPFTPPWTPLLPRR